MYDPIDNPEHYRCVANCPECGNDIEVISITERHDFIIGNVLKYILRSGRKGDALEDLKKAQWYLGRQIKKMEGRNE